MKSFVVFYNNGVTNGLSDLRGEKALQANQKIIEERLEANWAQVEGAKVLEGLTVHSRQELIGTLCVSGSQETIDRLKTFLEEKKLGTVVQNRVMFRGAGVA
jgi:hypothetical protein